MRRSLTLNLPLKWNPQAFGRYLVGISQNYVHISAFVLVIAILTSTPARSQQSPSVTPASRRIEARSIPKFSQQIAMTADMQKLAFSKGLVKENDATTRQIVNVHVMHGKKSGPQPRTEITAGNGPLSYYGGAVLTVPVIVPVFWGFNATNGVSDSSKDPNGMVPYLLNFLDSLAGSSWLATVNQYYQSNNNNQQHIQSGSLVVTNPIFDDSSSPGSSYKNSDVSNEAGKLVGSQISQNSNDIILIITPHNSANTDLSSNGDCAEHFSSQGLNWFTMVHNYTYISLPYIPDSGCGTNSVSSILDGVSIVGGHEIAEAITDPYSNNLANVGAWAAWLTSLTNGQEIGDVCQWNNIQNTMLAGGHAFATQPLWSNQANACVQASSSTGPFLTGAIRTSNGHFLTAVNGGGLGGGNAALQTDRTQAAGWETFELTFINSSLSQFTMSTYDGMFVSAVNGGGIGGPNGSVAPIHADTTTIGSWEKFTISEPVPCATKAQSIDVIKNLFAFCANIQTSDGHFVTAQNGGGIGGPNNIPIHTDATRAGSWEHLQLVPQN
jgi:hypothetical protein